MPMISQRRGSIINCLLLQCSSVIVKTHLNGFRSSHELLVA